MWLTGSLSSLYSCLLFSVRLSGFPCPAHPHLLDPPCFWFLLPWCLLFLGLQCGSAWCINVALFYAALLYPHSVAGDREGKPYSSSSQPATCQRSNIQVVKTVSRLSVSLLESRSEFRHAAYLRLKEHTCREGWDWMEQALQGVWGS